MELFKTLANRVDFVKNNIDKFILSAIEDTAQQLEEVQRDQMRIGENAEGKDIGKLRNRNYAKRKKAKGGKARFGVADLKNTGDFYDGIIAKVENKIIELTSTDKKTDLLEDKYGEVIFGLNENSKEDYILILVPVVIEKINKYMTNGTKP